MKSYNYDEFSTSDYDFDTVDGPDIGQKALDFLLTTTEGETRNLLDFSGDFLVLEMGSNQYRMDSHDLIVLPSANQRRRGFP